MTSTTKTPAERAAVLAKDMRARHETQVNTILPVLDAVANTENLDENSSLAKTFAAIEARTGAEITRALAAMKAATEPRPYPNPYQNTFRWQYVQPAVPTPNTDPFRWPYVQPAVQTPNAPKPETAPDAKQSLLDEAGAIVNGARRQAYGMPEDNFARIARFWQAYMENTGRASVAITAADVSPMMRLMKEARLCETPTHRDSFVDIIGYALTGAEVNGVKGEKP